MKTLLCTLGTSWPVVAEAFLKNPETYKRIGILTTASERIQLEPLRDFFDRYYSEVSVEIYRIQKLTDLETAEHHQEFEEILFRWYLNYRSEGLPDVCLAGGYKTMSACMQQAARLFGADDVFHVLAPDNPHDADAIFSAKEANRIHFIALGPEPGWPQLFGLKREDYPLTINNLETKNVYWVSCRDQTLRDESLYTLNLVQGNNQRLSSLPFSSIAYWPSHLRRWLEEPVNEITDSDWVQRLPKLELHSHLGGFATHGELLHKVRAKATYPEKLPPLKEPILPNGWPLPAEPIGLNPYRDLGDATGSAILSDPGCLTEHCKLLYEDLIAENILYAEIRCSPANYRKLGMSAWEALHQIRWTFRNLMHSAKKKDPHRWCQVNLIVIATRKDGGDLSDISRHLSLAITAAQEASNDNECNVVGVDLAGFEAKETRPLYFQSSFEAVHRCGLAVTVHAGENDDAESIWQAVHKLFARRLGHGLHLEDAPDLMRTVADRKIAVEMCPYANYQIKGFNLGGADYPLLRYLRQNILVTVNTDNRGISGAGVGDNLLLTARLCPGISRLDLLQLQRNAIESSFLSAGGRDALLFRYENSLTQP